MRWRRRVCLSVTLVFLSASSGCSTSSSASSHEASSSTAPVNEPVRQVAPTPATDPARQVSPCPPEAGGRTPVVPRRGGPDPDLEITRSASREVDSSLSIPDRSPVLRPVDRIDRVVMIGDSLIFDGGSRPGGRDNLVVDRLREIVQSTPELGDIAIENRALPGLAIKYGIGINVDPSRNTLVGYLPEILEAGLDGTDVVVIALSGIDLQTLADEPVSVVADDLLADLWTWYDELVATGAQVVFVPIFGVNTAMHRELLEQLEVSEPVDQMAPRIVEFNAAIRDAGLPLLIDGVRSLDPDGDGEVSRTFFVGYDDRVGGWPDDGIHPNHLGEFLYAAELGAALEFNLRWATAPAS